MRDTFNEQVARQLRRMVPGGFGGRTEQVSPVRGPSATLSTYHAGIPARYIGQDQVIKVDGNYNVPGTGGPYAGVPGLDDLTVSAVENDVLQVHAVGEWGAPGVACTVSADMATVVSGAFVNYVSQSGPGGNGIRPWGADVGSAGAPVRPTIAGIMLYTVTADDIVDGMVTLRFVVKSTTLVTIVADGTDPLVAGVLNVTFRT